MNLLKYKRDILTVFFALLIFVTGYLYGENRYIMNYSPEKGKIEKNNILQDFNNYFKNDNKLDIKLFYEAYSTIFKYYYSSNNISKRDLTYGMIKGMVDSLKDKHSEFFNIEETKKFNEALSGDFEGIGAVIQKNDFGVFIDRIIAGSPAKEAGLLSGDIIIKANSIDLKNMTVNEAVSKIRGPAGTVVKLEIIRPGEKENIIKEVTRRKIIIPSVDSKMLDNNVGYIILSIFGEKSGDEFKKSLDDLNTKGMKGLIIDLRDDGGGFLETAVQILSNFIEKDKVLVVTKEKNPLNNVTYFSRGNNYKDFPIVVLINGNSASASEITAGALKDYNLAIIVGEKSYGKGSVQQPFTLSDGSEMKITVAKWFTPLDNGIDGIGINPDFEIKFKKEDYDKKFDRQLDEGKKILLKSYEFGGDIKKTKEFFIKQRQIELRDKLNTITNSGNTLPKSNK